MALTSYEKICQIISGVSPTFLPGLLAHMIITVNEKNIFKSKGLETFISKVEEKTDILGSIAAGCPADHDAHLHHGFNFCPICGVSLRLIIEL